MWVLLQERSYSCEGPVKLLSGMNGAKHKHHVTSQVCPALQTQLPCLESWWKEGNGICQPWSLLSRFASQVLEVLSALINVSCKCTLIAKIHFPNLAICSFHHLNDINGNCCFSLNISTTKMLFPGWCSVLKSVDKKIPLWKQFLTFFFSSYYPYAEVRSCVWFFNAAWSTLPVLEISFCKGRTSCMKNR